MAKSKENTTRLILNFVQENPNSSSKEIHEGIGSVVAYATVKRLIQALLLNGMITSHSRGKATKYIISRSYHFLYPIEPDEYFKIEIDDRKINKQFNFELFKTISKIDLFTTEESERLNKLQEQFNKNISTLTPSEYKKEFERLAIDLSWKSSQIEGNTYTLLETEQLIKEKKAAPGKTKDEATMLLNHKAALDFIVDDPAYLIPLSTVAIEDIHSILVKDLNITRNIRNRRVGISGTNYQPLDNEFQIKEAMDAMCNLIKVRENIFEKALLALTIISYIQPFNDGNKRTARIVSNALLISYKYCPISFRTVDSVDYKKAMLIFYEQNNMSAFKKIFIDQFEFAVRTYF